MTTTGATEAVTPEQRLSVAQKIIFRWRDQGGKLAPMVAAALANAETDALRHALAVCQNYKARMDIAAGKPHPMTGERNGIAVCKADAANSLIESIRSLLPKEAGK